MTRSRRSWTRWWRTRQLARTVRRLHRIQRRQERVLKLQTEYLLLVEKLEHPAQLVSLLPSDSPIPTSVTMPPELELPPPLTPEEIEELKAMPMPDPLEEIEYRLGLSSTPPSPRILEG